MAQIRTGEPKQIIPKGRKPLFDDLIKDVAGKPNKYIYEKSRSSKETIRRRARFLGFTTQTFADSKGGWNIKID